MPREARIVVVATVLSALLFATAIGLAAFFWGASAPASSSRWLPFSRSLNTPEGIIMHLKDRGHRFSELRLREAGLAPWELHYRNPGDQRDDVVSLWVYSHPIDAKDSHERAVARPSPLGNDSYVYGCFRFVGPPERLKQIRAALE